MALSERALRHVSLKTQNPLHTILTEADNIVKAYPDYFFSKWVLVKQNLTAHVLHIETKNAFLNGAAKTAPNIYLTELIEELKDVTSNSYYFTAQYWRAFYHWLQNGSFVRTCPQFGEAEAKITVEMLTSEQLAAAAQKAKGDWSVDGIHDQRMLKIFKKLQPCIKGLCYRRVRYLSTYDPAMYSEYDLLQVVNHELLKRLQASDFNDETKDLTGWAVTCADNIIQNLREYAQADKRAKLIVTQVADKENGVEPQFLFRECAIHIPLKDEQRPNSHVTMSLADSVKLLEQPWEQTDSVHNKICYQQLMKIADPEIKQYLKIVWAGEHDVDFWTWFMFNEPQFAAQESYLQEHPEAVGMWVQRWLGLSDVKLIGFLHKNMPELKHEQKTRRRPQTTQQGRSTPPDAGRPLARKSKRDMVSTAA